jgi:tyrosinase
VITPVPAQAVVRRDVYANGGTFADPNLLWYARGVAAMQERPLQNPTSWRFYAAIHGFDQSLWKAAKFWSATEPPPDPTDRATFWEQCQHGTWYFLPWHRGYLLAFEAVVRDAIVSVGGPASWALPYWNYFATGHNALPPAFTEHPADWPGPGPNPLFIRRRFGPNGNGVGVSVRAFDINRRAMADDEFVGAGTGAAPGFGGPDLTDFEHGSSSHGALELNPHDQVHVDVGGHNAQGVRGLMGKPETAGLDPIFWLHHANIDRMWEAWLRNTSQGTPPHLNPDDASWLGGPTGPRVFAMPLPGDPAGSAVTWTYTPATMQDLTELNYSYDDLKQGTAPPITAPPTALAVRRLRPGAVDAEGAGVAEDQNVEMVGANDGPVAVARSAARTVVRLDAAMRDTVTASLAEVPGGVPDRVFLNLENIRGDSDGVTLRVYVDLPEGADPADHPELLAGSIGLFGVSAASRRDGEHGGDGLTSVLEITTIVDALHVEAAVPESLTVDIVPRQPLPPGMELTIGRVSVFRQGR